MEMVTLRESDGSAEMVFTDGNGGKRIVTASEPLAAWARDKGSDFGKIEVDPAVRDLMISDGGFARTVFAVCVRSRSDWKDENVGDFTITMNAYGQSGHGPDRCFRVTRCRESALVDMKVAAAK